MGAHMKIRTGFSLLAAALLLQPAMAADDAQAKKLQQMQRKFAQEKSALEGQLREANRKADESSKQAEEAAGKSAALGGRLRRAEDERKKLSEALDEVRQQLAEQKDLAVKLSGEGSDLKARLGRQEEANAQCSERNQRLYQYGSELLGHYEGRGFLGRLAQAEPFTQIKRVEVENLVEDYREKLEDAKLPVQAGR